MMRRDVQWITVQWITKKSFKNVEIYSIIMSCSTNIVISDVIFQITCKLRNAESMNDEVMNGKPDRE